MLTTITIRLGQFVIPAGLPAQHDLWWAVVKQIEEIISNQGAAALFNIFYCIAEFLGLCLRPDLIGYFGHSLRVPLKSGTRSLRHLRPKFREK